MVNMLSNAKNNHSIKFLGSDLYGKMCSFVSVCCLLQMLCHFLYNFLDFSGSGRVQQRVQNEAFGTLFQLGTWQIVKIDTLRIKKNQVA